MEAGLLVAAIECGLLLLFEIYAKLFQWGDASFFAVLKFFLRQRPCRVPIGLEPIQCLSKVREGAIRRWKLAQSVQV